MEMLRALRIEQASMPDATLSSRSTVSIWSWTGLCATSFFLADVNGVTMPFVNTYLHDCGWRYDAIGVVMAVTALISLLMTLPCGLLIDRTLRRRFLLAAASLLVGASFGIFPLVQPTFLWIGGLLAMAAIARPFFGPLTNALTLDLVGHTQMDRAVGIRQGWDHAGNITAAVTAIALVTWLPVASVFFASPESRSLPRDRSF
jgi:predicted MFS family arabinose efflux permease